jgi:hypothetical protein
MISKLLHFFSFHSHLILVLFLMGGIMSASFLIPKNRMGLKFLFAFFLPVIGVGNFIYGRDINANYVDSHGVTSQAVVTEINATNTTVNHVRELEYKTLIKTNDNNTVESYFNNNKDVFYPKTDIWSPPSIGETFAVKYMPNDPENFIILTQDTNSNYSNKLICTEIQVRLSAAKAKYSLDNKNSEFKTAYKTVIQEILKAKCDTSIKYIYKLELNKLMKD